MTKKLQLLALAACSMLSSINNLHAGGGTDWSSVTQIYNYSSGVVRAFISPAHSDPDACERTGHLHIAVDADKNMCATLLAAFIVDKQVSFYMSGCVRESGSTAVKIT